MSKETEEERKKRLANNAKRWRLNNPEKFKKINKANAKKYREQNREKYNESMREYRSKNPEIFKAIRKKWLDKNPEFKKVVQRRANLKFNYGITVSEYDALCKKQDSKCSICNKTCKLVVDHCHSTGIVRGLLCNHCNSALGSFF